MTTNLNDYRIEDIKGIVIKNHTQVVIWRDGNKSEILDAMRSHKVGESTKNYLWEFFLNQDELINPEMESGGWVIKITWGDEITFNLTESYYPISNKKESVTIQKVLKIYNDIFKGYEFKKDSSLFGGYYVTKNGTGYELR